MKKNFKVYCTEKLQRVCSVRAGNENEAIDIAEQKYKNCEIVLDESDFKEVEISASAYTHKEQRLLDEIHNYCRSCAECNNCPEEECILFRLE